MSTMKDESKMTHPVLVNHKGDTMFVPNQPIYPMTLHHPSGKVSKVLVQVLNEHTDPHLGSKEHYKRINSILVLKRLNNIFIPQLPA